jgi:hypothetical protein
MKHLRLFLALFTLMIGGASASAQSWTGSEVGEGTYYLYNVGADKFLAYGEAWGTRAIIDDVGIPLTLESNNGAYRIKTNVESGNSKVYLGSDFYVDQDACDFTFTPVEGLINVYNLSYMQGGTTQKFRMWVTGAKTFDQISSVSAGATWTLESTQWMLISKDERDAKFAAREPLDITYKYINDPNTSYFYNIYDPEQSWTSGSWGMEKHNKNGTWRDKCGEVWDGNFNINKTISDVPNGTYRFSVMGFYRNGGALADPFVANAKIYANDATTDLQSLAVGATAEGLGGRTVTYNGQYVPDSREAACYYFQADKYPFQSVEVVVTNNTLQFGVKKETLIRGDWTVVDKFRLYYVGPLDLTEFANALAAAVSHAEETQGTIPTACYGEIASVVSQYNQTYDNEDDYTEAINAINNAVATYASPEIVAAYNKYQTIRTAVLNINSDIDVSNADALANDGTDANLDDAITAVRAALSGYLATVTTVSDGIDITAAMLENPGFELGNINGWSNTGNQAAAAQGNKAFDNTQGNYYAERWHQNGTVNLNQTVSNLAAGVYEIGAYLFTDTSDGKLYANGSETNFSTSGWYTVSVAIDANGSITFGAKCTLTGSTWICMDGFTLTYKGGLPDVTAVEGKMNKDVADAQTEAIATYNAEKTVANYNAAVAAINAAQASVEAYAKLAPHLAKIDAALADATSATESADAYNTIKTAYNEGTIADADIIANIASAYDAVIPVIKSQTAEQADFTFAIQNQSFEYGNMTGWTANNSSDTGVRETSNATYAATGSDGTYLFNTWWQGVPITQEVANLPNGQYTLTVSVASDGATIYLLANGEHNEGIETYETTDVEQGQYSKDTFQETTFTFLVKDGTATIGVVGGANGNAGEHKDYIEEGYWWYKADNFRLVKNRDLTHEEEFVEATTEDYAALTAAIEAAEANTLGFEEGEYAPYNNVEAITALNVAKEIDPSAVNSQEDVQAATAAITNANWTANTEEVNAIYDGDFAIQEVVPQTNTRPIGWQRNSVIANQQNGDDGGYETRLVAVPEGATSTNKGMMTKFHAFYGEQTGYTLPLKANTTYELKFMYAGWNNKPTMHINIYNEEGTKVAVSDNFTAKSNNGHNSADGWTEYYYVFTTTDAGNYVIGLIKNSGGTQQNQAGFGDMTLFKVKQEPVTINSGFLGTTYSSENALDFSSATGLTAYIITGVNNGTCNATPVTKVPAGTGVYVEGEAVVEGDPVTYTVNVYGGSDTDDVEGNLLVGTVAESVTLLSDANTTYYRFGKQNGKESFFRVGTEKSSTASAHKAYLKIETPVANNAKSLIIVKPGEDLVSDDGGFADGINNVEQADSNAKIYNLNGQRVNNAHKGIYIMNGKKVIIK